MTQLWTIGLLTILLSPGETPAYTLKIADKTEPPAEVADVVRNELTPRALQLVEANGELVLELWLRRELRVKATEGQIKNGLTYAEVPATSVLGVTRIVQPVSDYRKQPIPAGIYTLRLATQPTSDDHQGTAPTTDFCLLSPVSDDRMLDLIEPKALHKLSAKTTGKHPAVWLLLPPTDVTEVTLLSRPKGHWILAFPQPVQTSQHKGTLGINLTLLGASSAL